MSMSSQPPAPQRRFKRPVVFVCDIQDKFRTTIWNFDKMVLTAAKVLRAAHILRLPVHTTTQNRARLGDTVPELAALLTPRADGGALVHPPVDKTRFSMWVPEVAAQLTSDADAKADADGPAEVILVGIEAHICVTQTALDLLANGHKVYVLADGVSSCNREEVGVALARLRAEGVTVTTSESVMYELMGDAKVAEFKQIVGLVKDTSAQTRDVLQSLL
ncbi:isochorismatase domain-containing protein [Sodiomyces alkalinus F11]|uniref:Isochorismatase domain-containing protein n=1 Tax=Sodiomyces alkalinus (strain CBS 110278 / VKM F-3762 / F11) TaxID=1314773 RepID=A0A3N2PW94_SODAK|nr:isochorismatase domain-containing protein [Sodiomyces alkalinus F11]ROT38789.1 isochorismatase domain-containing protein [Sodiomyces alkalinus F11]